MCVFCCDGAEMHVVRLCVKCISRELKMHGSCKRLLYDFLLDESANISIVISVQLAFKLIVMSARRLEPFVFIGNRFLLESSIDSDIRS